MVVLALLSYPERTNADRVTLRQTFFYKKLKNTPLVDRATFSLVAFSELPVDLNATYRPPLGDYWLHSTTRSTQLLGVLGVMNCESSNTHGVLHKSTGCATHSS